MKTLKYEEVYRQEYRDLAEARACIERFLERVYITANASTSASWVNRPPVEFELSLFAVSQPNTPQQATA